MVVFLLTIGLLTSGCDCADDDDVNDAGDGGDGDTGRVAGVPVAENRLVVGDCGWNDSDADGEVVGEGEEETGVRG